MSEQPTTPANKNSRDNAAARAERIATTAAERTANACISIVLAANSRVIDILESAAAAQRRLGEEMLHLRGLTEKLIAGTEQMRDIPAVQRHQHDVFVGRLRDLEAVVRAVDERLQAVPSASTILERLALLRACPGGMWREAASVGDHGQ